LDTPARDGRAGNDPRPAVVVTELERLVRRWRELPLTRAEVHAPELRAAAEGLAGQPLSDLGPATALDQLRVLVWDACARGETGGIPELLVALRRRLD
jgi:hypothetical protein